MIIIRKKTEIMNLQIELKTKPNLILRNEHSRTGSNFTQFTLTGQIISHRRSLKLRFCNRNQMIAFQISQETFVNKSSASHQNQ